MKLETRTHAFSLQCSLTRFTATESDSGRHSVGATRHAGSKATSEKDQGISTTPDFGRSTKSRSIRLKPPIKATRQSRSNTAMGDTAIDNSHRCNSSHEAGIYCHKVWGWRCSRDSDRYVPRRIGRFSERRLLRLLGRFGRKRYVRLFAFSSQSTILCLSRR